MSRLHEYQGKALLREVGIRTPVGEPASTPDEAQNIAEGIDCQVVVKAQIWMTGRAEVGGIRFAKGPAETRDVAAEMLGTTIGHFTVDKVLVEEKLEVAQELYVAILVDDEAQAPTVLLSTKGGTGVEEVEGGVTREIIDIRDGLRCSQAIALAQKANVPGIIHKDLSKTLISLFQLARRYDALTLEINPLVVTSTSELIAADCRITVDDNAIFRHPDLGIQVAREFDHPPTRLETIAWGVEKDDYRGTFYFVEIPRLIQGSRVIGFHGSGGGGSMLSMDALLGQDLHVANFTDTSGNPPASKVYRAARIILSQDGISGYFMSGGGVASQEQFHSARGVVKAFLEEPLLVPAVLRLGGNQEEYAREILNKASQLLRAPLESYGKEDSAEFCAERMRFLIDTWETPSDPLPQREMKPAGQPYSFETVSGGTVTLDHSACVECETKICIETCSPKILQLEEGVPILNITFEEAKSGGCTECLACDVTCYLEGNQGGYVNLPIQGFEETMI
ncbi:MAG: succinyl-CoA synthetase subunit beta [Trueperaceae bacterium]|nr:succinyl-CoA synthetase subunit beta [Trueperaceae bacterium]